MATSANPPPGAIPAIGSGDPFVGPGSGPLRYASFDTEQFSVYSSNSPSHAKRALEAHLKDTDRRIQDASRLGTTLLQQRKELSARLQEVELVQKDDEVPAELRAKLAELEREYNEVGRESARAFLPKSRASEVGTTPTVLSGQARDSPTKVSAPSRRQRNQASNRVHDIEFATEISTSLLAQVRQLQAALAEKDDALKETTSAKAQLEAEAAGMVQRIKYMDEHEQRYKDENWNLETKLQELEASHREISDKHDRLSQTLKATQSDKAGAQRELDELKLSHEKLTEDHAITKRQQEVDIHGLRRDAAAHESEKQMMQRKIVELTAQNTELAKAVSYRWNQPSQATDSEFVSAAEDQDDEDYTPDHSEPGSPIKGTPRHGMLESETLKSSLNHAHRMIQNLKNNIHREKTEKIELKRMLQDARDELEARRGETGMSANVARKRRSEQENAKFKKPIRPERLGATRSSTTEILGEDSDWEDHEGERTPSKTRFSPTAGAIALGMEGTSVFDVAAGSEGPESTDAFETANEKDLTTETEAFETGNEELPEDESDLTETEGDGSRSNTLRGKGISPLVSRSAGDRHSFQSTASTSADEAEDEVRTPIQAQAPKYRLRMTRGNRKAARVSEMVADSPYRGSPDTGLMSSPASSMGTPQQGQTLGDELDALEEDSIEDTPSKYSEGFERTPEAQRQMSVGPETPKRNGEGVVESIETGAGDDRGLGSCSSTATLPSSPPRRDEGEFSPARRANSAILAHEHRIKQSSYVDAGMMTEPWETDNEIASHRHSPKFRAGEVVGGALAGFGLGRLRREEDDREQHPESGVERLLDGEHPAIAGVRETDAALQRPVTATKDNQDGPGISTAPGLKSEPKSLSESVAEPLAAAKAKESSEPSTVLQHSDLIYQETEPLAAAMAREYSEPRTVLQRSDFIYQETEPLAAAKAKESSEPSTALQHSDLIYQETEPLAAAKANESSGSSRVLQHSDLIYQETEPVSSLLSMDPDFVKNVASHPQVPLEIAAPLAVRAAQRSSESELGFSTIESQHYEPSDFPESPLTPLMPKRSSRRLNGLYGSRDTQTDFYNDSQQRQKPSTSEVYLPGLLNEDAPNLSVIEPKVFGGVLQKDHVVPATFFEDEGINGQRAVLHPEPLAEVPTTVVPSAKAASMKAPEVAKPLLTRKPMADEGSQTIMSGSEIDEMLRKKSRNSSFVDAGVSLINPIALVNSPRRSMDGAVAGEATALVRTPKRPASAGSMRSKGTVAVPPPLPEDYTQKITAASQKVSGSSGTAMATVMGPPLIPASAYKQNRPKTPGQERSMSRDGTTPRPVRRRDSTTRVQSPTGMSRRTSVSSFASELDERFNITRGDLIYPSDVPPSTDPRMIQAITQTMIGEYLWKYTRKAGRSETSTTRHRRFFWVHPYTRTLYWSEQDPTTAGRNMLKAKSVQIQSVRVITDDNAFPPGLHRKSIVVITPGREIVFTTPTSQRHETWFNALSYLLLRSEQEKGEANDAFNRDDLDEFNPGGFSFRRSISRMTGRDRSISRSRQSLSSYNSRTTRTSSPQRRDAGSLAQGQSAAVARSGQITPTLHPSGGTMTSRLGVAQNHDSVSGRFSTITSKFRPSSSQRGSYSTRRGRSSLGSRSGMPGDPGEIYDASVIGESAEDLRAVIERQERDADLLENVRACCDGQFTPKLITPTPC